MNLNFFAAKKFFLMESDPEINVTIGYDETGKKIVENYIRHGTILKMVLFRDDGKPRYKKEFSKKASEDREYF
jgi:hypothetical protein